MSRVINTAGVETCLYRNLAEGRPGSCQTLSQRSLPHQQRCGTGVVPSWTTVQGNGDTAASSDHAIVARLTNRRIPRAIMHRHRVEVRPSRQGSGSTNPTDSCHSRCAPRPSSESSQLSSPVRKLRGGFGNGRITSSHIVYHDVADRASRKLQKLLATSAVLVLLPRSQTIGATACIDNLLPRNLSPTRDRTEPRHFPASANFWIKPRIRKGSDPRQISVNPYRSCLLHDPGSPQVGW